MQKNKDMLLILSAEERTAAKNFIARRLKTLDKDQLPQLQVLSQLSKQIVRRTQIDKSQYARNPSRAGQLLVKLHDAALVDLQALIKDVEQTTYTLHQKSEKAGKTGQDAVEDQKAEDLVIMCDEEEVGHASDVLKERLEKLRVPELKIFRDSCQEVLRWWESERGQIESLHLDAFGDINSASGRLLIRQKREQMQKEVFNPFKAFFREMNTSYQRLSKEAASTAKMRAAQESSAKST